jgi:hypothetical protein
LRYGFDGLFVTCPNVACLHSTAFAFATLGLEDDVRFPSVFGVGGLDA